jgi:hypothetical protein
VALALFSPSYFSALLQPSDFLYFITNRKSKPYSKKNARTLAGTILYAINPTKSLLPSSLALSKIDSFCRLASLLKASLEG